MQAFDLLVSFSLSFPHVVSNLKFQKIKRKKKFSPSPPLAHEASFIILLLLFSFWLGGDRSWYILWPFIIFLLAIKLTFLASLVSFLLRCLFTNWKSMPWCRCTGKFQRCKKSTEYEGQGYLNERLIAATMGLVFPRFPHALFFSLLIFSLWNWGS